ncbi:helix-turn-helix transcriptional regulator [Actinomycetospora cinnamomea]|uniref:helix-turn-helix transcriptional regulator n=1 Tax=Actinomycetospora cinnamomea TaxID=663609 RepID=UPI003C2F7743
MSRWGHGISRSAVLATQASIAPPLAEASHAVHAAAVAILSARSATQAEFPLLTEREVARRLAVSLDTVRRLRSRGSGPRAVRVGARAVRYRPQDVDAWLRSRSGA